MQNSTKMLSGVIILGTSFGQLRCIVEPRGKPPQFRFFGFWDF